MRLFLLKKYARLWLWYNGFCKHGFLLSEGCDDCDPEDEEDADFEKAESFAELLR